MFVLKSEKIRRLSNSLCSSIYCSRNFSSSRSTVNRQSGNLLVSSKFNCSMSKRTFKWKRDRPTSLVESRREHERLYIVQRLDFVFTVLKNVTVSTTKENCSWRQTLYNLLHSRPHSWQPFLFVHTVHGLEHFQRVDATLFVIILVGRPKTNRSSFVERNKIEKLLFRFSSNLRRLLQESCRCKWSIVASSSWSRVKPCIPTRSHSLNDRTEPKWSDEKRRRSRRWIFGQRCLTTLPNFLGENTFVVKRTIFLLSKFIINKSSISSNENNSTKTRFSVKFSLSFCCRSSRRSSFLFNRWRRHNNWSISFHSINNEICSFFSEQSDTKVDQWLDRDLFGFSRAFARLFNGLLARLLSVDSVYSSLLIHCRTRERQSDNLVANSVDFERARVDEEPIDDHSPSWLMKPKSRKMLRIAKKLQ